MGAPGNIAIIELESPDFDAAKKRLAELLTVFSFNAVVTLLDQLIAEVDSMPLAQRFDPNKLTFSVFGKGRENASRFTNPRARNMSEAEYKRFQLRQNLQEVRTDVLNLSLKFETVFLDMQASKTD